MFRPVDSKVNFPQLEKTILSFWKQHQIFEKSLETRRGATQFTLYEGPPTANGSPGIHHVLSRVFKDVIPRHRTMKGYYVPRKAGWDTHGLPVELEVEKMLGFTGKAQIEEYGVAKFNALCRESVFKYLKEWDAMTERIGFWLDLEHAYRTLENSYIESCWWALKQLWDKNLIYQGYRVTPHCPRCGTSLSSHEVALGYRDDAKDPSVYIKFKLARSSVDNLKLPVALPPSDKPVFLLAWTTTPWTLPGNTALAVASEAHYSIMEGSEDYLILAAALAERIGLDGYKSIATVSGKDLVGLEYQPLFNPHDFDVERGRFGDRPSEENLSYEILTPQKADTDLTYRVIPGDFVSMEEGTGIVHIAPAFGEVDFEAGKSEGLDFVQPVDLDGKMTGTYPFAGKFVKDADPLVLEDLKSRGLLYRSEQIVHTYPFCWRCEAPLVYYAKRTWYIRTSLKKEALLAGNAEINWYPEHIKYGRFGNWLENNVDWAFSRERYWGTPLNIWNCSSCGSYECIGSLDELKAKPNLEGLIEPLDLHRPFVDDIAFSCSKCGGRMKRQAEVIDCWFDSGAMPFAQWHYPFENQDTFKRNFPADYISEAVDQTRGWFYSLHAISTLIFDRPCFNNVICLGHILDAEGDKMSKAKGNVVDPWSVLDKYGADALRWYLFTAAPAGNVRRFSSDAVSEVLRNFLLTLWNVYSFFVIYANIDRFDPKSAGTPALSDLDRWILSRLNQLVADVDGALDNYDPTSAGRKIEGFVDELSNWYVRRSRRRFWKSQSDADKLAAYSTLYNCLVTLSKLLAPFTPFIAEEIYRNLVCPVEPEAVESVHMADFPVADLSQVDEKLIEATRLAMTVCSLGRAARAKSGIKVRQPLSIALVKVRSAGEKEALQKLTYQILEELNVKELEFCEGEEVSDRPGYVSAAEGDYWVAVATELSPELEAEGVAREVVRRLQTMRRSAGLDIADHILTYYEGGDSIQLAMTKFADYIKQETLSQELIAAVSPVGSHTEKFRISNYEISLGIKKAS
ncbi:MAG: isoleucine--tRNA ligase [Chloroflexi bacterium RBG_19FT_COMBO_48_23]|nr:MAG: isoleucine--tRNA ligase [Chloroflexi bacterium RBG_19FT_COMBO_48_23]